MPPRWTYTKRTNPGLTPANRESPVSFRPGKLRAALRQRERGSIKEGQIAKRDLGRFYLLLGEALSNIQLTTYEGRMLARLHFQLDARESTRIDPFLREHHNPSDFLLRLVKDEVSSLEQCGETPSPRLYALLDKVESLNPLERAAVLDAIDRLPFESEEQFGDRGDWELIGVHLMEPPLVVEDIIQQ